ncbi:T9SS type A sorting domain-containing protein [Mangrovimonas sp. YM274]|uniref:T9SS type A sorting domain-containing protein n=1 Tax=Mangrovimonas sp. YM274 TaxID=3070660 RepID=UPI0027DE0EE3|nr:T9SS type A sorting domain-containing protein [Mangrovimonas sp. YM274]WMI70217.1 T9SS type A sorting domain-containing protein [Mangrovimonas sp. YM274]
MKKLLLLGCFAALGTINTFGQTTFGWETLQTSASTSKSETIDGITLTATTPGGTTNMTVGSAVFPGLSGKSLQCYTSSTIFTFDTPVNITSMVLVSFYTEEDFPFTLTPEGEENEAVTVENSEYSATATLNWENVTSFTVTSPITFAIFDNLIVENATLSTSEIAMEEIALYPNPTSSTLHITGITGITSAEVFNSLGQLVLRNAASEIHVEALSPGVYILKVTTDKGNFTKQFVKE